MSKIKISIIFLTIAILLSYSASTVFAVKGIPTITRIKRIVIGPNPLEPTPTDLQGSTGATGPQGPTGPQGATGIQGLTGNPGESGFIPDKEINVCFHVPTGALRVMLGGTCGQDVQWKIPVRCVSGKPCQPDNPNDPFYQ